MSSSPEINSSQLTHRMDKSNTDVDGLRGSEESTNKPNDLNSTAGAAVPACLQFVSDILLLP